ncbi:ATP-binding protein [Vibrio agarivorans]|uniref:ATP-binding protein n=1 Tax=Vibrio agarivorans TaxID=153622 RepID=A0ABT7XXF5_9VIBR|nr:ATP-binding protein [Vibrio agarivorans]MDN2480450.1 ATP-binding protein [Vibrio agarivorans]
MTTEMESVLKVGEVCEVNGKTITIRVYKNKNLSDLFYNGTIIRNVSVGSFIEIKKGFTSLIGKIDGEKLIEDRNATLTSNESTSPIYQRFLTISLSGYINRSNKFVGGTAELPLIGNEAYILTDDKITTVHNVGTATKNQSIEIAETHIDKMPISLPIDGLLNTHMAIFGNTGSGKSNTLTAIYKSAYQKLESTLGNEKFNQRCKFILFDFNGEYTAENCITNKKKVYELTTRTSDGQKLPLSGDGILDIEVISIICEATEKTQKPLLERALRKYKSAKSSNNSEAYVKGILRNQVKKTLLLADKPKITTVIGYFRSVFNNADNLESDIIIYSNNGQVKLLPPKPIESQGYIDNDNSPNIINTNLYSNTNTFQLEANEFNNFIKFVYIQLIEDLLYDRVTNDHVKPVLGKLKQKKKHIEKVLSFNGGDFWDGTNFVVISLDKVNIDIKKLLPLLVAKTVYDEKKESRGSMSLNIIIDEAHNILSNESFRETEAWKDHRLETFEEIIKEGRKFGTFLTISSQRPNDISHTITSQAHNYFIHRLVNERDLHSISRAVSYIDSITEESIPTLPTGVCIFSGVSTQIPLKLRINELSENEQPHSNTFEFFKEPENETAMPRIEFNENIFDVPF